MQDGDGRAPDRSAHRAGGRGQRGDRLAERDPHAPGPNAAQTAAAREPGTGVPPRGDDGRPPEPRERRAALSFTAWMLGHSIDVGEDSEVRKHIS